MAQFPSVAFTLTSKRWQDQTLMVREEGAKKCMLKLKATKMATSLDLSQIQ